MDILNIFLQRGWMKLLLPLSVLVITLIVGWIAKRFLFRSLHRWAEKTKTHADDILIQAFCGPLMIWVLILGLHLATQSSRKAHLQTFPRGRDRNSIPDPNRIFTRPFHQRQAEKPERI